MNAAGEAQPAQGIGHHARVTYAQVAAQGAPQQPQEENDPPAIFTGQRGVMVTVLTDPDETDAIPQRQEHVYLVRSDVELPDRAYRIVSEKKSLGRDWGRMVFALVLPRAGNGRTFQEPRQGEAEYVAIKEIEKRKMNDYLRRGGHENPYRDIQRMQRIGDNLHVIQCVEALEDDFFLYTIMPKCEGSLVDAIPWSSTEQTNCGWLSEPHASSLFSQILQNLHYLQSHGLCHHDLSPDNMMLYKGRILFIDFAMSLRVPHNADSGIRQLIRSQGCFGKEPYMAPEIAANATFDGYAIDLWSAATSLCNVLITDYLYYKAHPVDTLFKYFIMAGGLSNMPLNERSMEILMEMSCDPRQRQLLLSRVKSHLNLSADVVHLLQHMLILNPANRFNLAQCIESRWIQDNAPR